MVVQILKLLMRKYVVPGTAVTTATADTKRRHMTAPFKISDRISASNEMGMNEQPQNNTTAVPLSKALQKSKVPVEAVCWQVFHHLQLIMRTFKMHT